MRDWSHLYIGRRIPEERSSPIKMFLHIWKRRPRGSTWRENNGKNNRSSQTGRNMPERTRCQWEYNPDRQLFFDLLAAAQNQHSEIPDRTLCTSWLWSRWAVYFYHQEHLQSSDSKNYSEWDRHSSSKVYSPGRQNLTANSAALQALKLLLTSL